MRKGRPTIQVRMDPAEIEALKAKAAPRELAPYVRDILRAFLASPVVIVVDSAAAEAQKLVDMIQSMPQPAPPPEPIPEPAAPSPGPVGIRAMPPGATTVWSK